MWCRAQGRGVLPVAYFDARSNLANMRVCDAIGRLGLWLVQNGAQGQALQEVLAKEIHVSTPFFLFVCLLSVLRQFELNFQF